MPTADARFAFFEPENAAPSPARRAVDAAASGHAPAGGSDRPYWRFAIGPFNEIRLTTFRGALWLRQWHVDAAGKAWPVPGARLLRLDDREAGAFADAVAAAAAELLNSEGKHGQ